MFSERKLERNARKTNNDRALASGVVWGYVTVFLFSDQNLFKVVIIFYWNSFLITDSFTITDVPHPARKFNTRVFFLFFSLCLYVKLTLLSQNDKKEEHIWLNWFRNRRTMKYTTSLHLSLPHDPNSTVAKSFSFPFLRNLWFSTSPSSLKKWITRNPSTAEWWWQMKEQKSHQKVIHCHIKGRAQKKNSFYTTLRIVRKISEKRFNEIQRISVDVFW